MCKRCGKLFDVALPGGLEDFLPKGPDFRADEAHVHYKRCMQGLCDGGASLKVTGREIKYKRMCNLN